jgi:hypothetical protein
MMMADSRPVFWCLLLTALFPSAGRAEDRRETTVGMVARIDQIVLPGPELEVRPLNDRAKPVVLRILNTYPHGTAFRYDLAYYVLDPGTFDLKDYLQRKDGSSMKDVPSLRVTVRPLLPAGQVQPNALVPAPVPSLGGYRTLLIVAGAAWLVGLIAIAYVGRRRHEPDRSGEARPLTMADRLRPLIERGVAGKLAPAECADLERTLLAYWRRRLDLQDQRPLEAFACLRAHAEAGPLLEQLEMWLHRPGAAQNVNVGALLEPYRALPVDEVLLTAEKQARTA